MMVRADEERVGPVPFQTLVQKKKKPIQRPVLAHRLANTSGQTGRPQEYGPRSLS